MPFGYRPDGDRCRDLPATRRIMPFIMRRRNEALVYFEQKLDPKRARAFLDEARARTGKKATLLHLVAWAIARTLAERPRLNRFVAGGRIYQRRGIWLSMSVKKEVSDDGAIVVVKREVDPARSFDDLVRDLTEDVSASRSDRPSATDKELALLFRLPALLLGWLVGIQRLLDDWGLLPGVFYRQDPLYASAFLANLGSLGMDAAFHHLYEYGNIPIFVTLGAARDEVVPGPDRTPVVAERLTIRYAFDERIEDGLYCLSALDRVKAIVEDPTGA
jgi:hypothetical protein